MSQLGVILQESRNRERETITILGLLREQMDSVDGSLRRKRTLKEWLGFGMGCCGGSGAFGPTSTMSVRDDEEEEEEDDEHHPQQQNQQQEHIQVISTGTGSVSGPDCVAPTQIQTSSGMNLAAALAAERQFRGSHEPEAALIRSITDISVGPTDDDRTVEITRPGTPLRVSLMRLLELTTDRGDQGEVVMAGTEKTETERVGVVEGSDSVCCVCMVRKKGAAFIPCGHTFCRVCTRELWLTRGSCPLCNRPILEILDIF